MEGAESQRSAIWLLTLQNRNHEDQIRQSLQTFKFTAKTMERTREITIKTEAPQKNPGTKEKGNKTPSV